MLGLALLQPESQEKNNQLMTGKQQQEFEPRQSKEHTVLEGETRAEET